MQLLGFSVGSGGGCSPAQTLHLLEPQYLMFLYSSGFCYSSKTLTRTGKRPRGEIQGGFSRGFPSFHLEALSLQLFLASPFGRGTCCLLRPATRNTIFLAPSWYWLAFK